MTDPFDLNTNDRGELILSRPGQDEIVNVRLRRAFPWSSPTKFVSIRSSEGKELVMIEDLATLAPDLRRRIEATLESGRFVPVIRKIRSVDVRFGHQEWDVETDKGPVKFRVQEREDVRFLGDGRFSVKDAEGNVYEVPPLIDLDEESRRAVEPLL